MEDAATYGLKIGAQSWTADFQDINNDGALDCFITNHDTRSQILLNDGSGHFNDITDAAGIGNLDFPLQGVMRDFDNDGFVDIIVAGDQSYYFHNNGDLTFTELEIDDLFDASTIHTYAIGDLNHDGFLDVVASYGSGFNSSSPNKNDIIWLNDGNDNNYIVFNLLGNASNINGVGARIEVYGAWGKQIREVRAGESYGIHNTFSQHFGLGDATSVDSVIVRWPSGNIDKVEDLATNQFIQINEGGCISPNASLSFEGSTTFCSGDSVIITAPDDLSYNWSTGAQTQSIVVYDAGTYNVTVSDGGSCEGVSVSVEVVVDPDDTPTISTVADTINCPGTVVRLTASEGTGYVWSDGSMTQSIDVNAAGSYTVQIQGTCGAVVSEPFILEEFQLSPPVVEGDTVISSGSGTLLAQGDTIDWYDSEVGGMLLGSGPEFVTPVVTQTTTYWVEEAELFKGAPINGGKIDFGDVGQYTSVNFGGLTFTLNEEVLLRSVKVKAEEAGMRTIGFFDRITNDFLGNTNVMIPEGESRVILNKVLPASADLSMYVNSEAGLFYETTASEIDFPYSLGDYGQINGGVFDENYYYFYDLEFEPTKEALCIGKRVPVDLVVEFNVNVSDIDDTDAIHISPNPTLGELNLRYDLATEGRMEIYNVQGQLMDQRILSPKGTEALDLSAWPKGVFWLKVYSAENTYLGKVVLQ